MLARIVKIALLIFIFMAAAGISTYLTIHVLIRSEDTVVVPDLVGKEVVYTLEVLTDLGLNTKVKGSEFSPSVPKHHIIAQDPEPGSEIKQGRDVRLVISKGARTVVLPNLTGISVPQARIVLQENGLRQGNLSYTYDKDQPKGEILAQHPLPAASGLRDDRVNLLVSSGAAPRRIPMLDLRGMGLSQAIAAIERLQLVLGVIQPSSDPNVADETVVEHTPGSGYPVLIGDGIDLIINRHAQATIEQRPEKVVLFRHRSNRGFLKQHVRVLVNRPNAAVELFNAFVKPGEEIWLLVPEDEPSTLLLYVDDDLLLTKSYD